MSSALKMQFHTYSIRCDALFSLAVMIINLLEIMDIFSSMTATTSAVDSAATTATRVAPAVCLHFLARDVHQPLMFQYTKYIVQIGLVKCTFVDNSERRCLASILSVQCHHQTHSHTF